MKMVIKMAVETGHAPALCRVGW